MVCMQDGVIDVNASDEALMLLYAQGQVAAFNTLYARHELGMWRYIYRSVQNHATADELMQDVWFAIARAAATYEPHRNHARWKTWAFTLAHHRMVDHWRTLKTHTSIDAEGDEAIQLRAQLIADSGFGPVRQIESREQARALIEAVDSLPADQRAAFLLQAEAGMGVQEIAACIGVSFETAKSRLRYARSKLKTLLAEFAEARV
jgi:RNA polymerase sigma factor (sigma-70 family)